jgi:hypothetical protein
MNIFYNNTDNNTLDNSIHRNEIELSMENNGRRCGYCRHTGHNVLSCNDSAISNGRSEIHEIINDNIYTSIHRIENIINEWLEDKSDNLLKAIFCSNHVIKYSCFYRRPDIESIIKNYVINNIYFLRISQHTDIGNVVPSATITILLPYRALNTLRDLYKHLSIKVAMARIRIQHLDKECPICFNEVTYENIQKTNCNHEFCKECLTKTIKGFANRRSKSKCPICRMNIETIYQNKKFVNETLDDI